MTSDLLAQEQPIGQLRNFDPINAAAYNSDRIASILRTLAYQAVSCVFADGPRPLLSRSDAKALQPLFGGDDWYEKRSQSYLGFLDSVLFFTGERSDFRENAMVQAVGATVQKRVLRRWSARRKAKGSGLVGAKTLIPTALGAAWSDPHLQMHISGTIRSNWRKRTLFHPEAVDWPDRFSNDLILIIMNLALCHDQERPKRSYLRFIEALRAFRRRPIHNMQKLLLRCLDPAFEQVGAHVSVEHLIAADAISQVQSCKGLEAVEAFCLSSSVIRRCGFSPVRELDAGLLSELEQEPIWQDDDDESAICALGKRLAGRLL
nr:hypothetical protein [uncultured Cohaesibacter sp.]